MGVFVEEEVVACGIFGDPHREVFDLRWVSAAQPDHFLFGVDLLLNEETESYPRGMSICTRVGRAAN